MNKQYTNQTDLVRETLRVLASRRLSPTPDNYTNIYAEISGIPAKETFGPEQVLLDIANHLAQSPKSAPTGAALQKVIQNQNWDQYFINIQALLSLPEKNKIQLWSPLISNLLRQLGIPHKGLTTARKKEGLDTVLKRFANNPETLFEKLHALINSWSETPTADAIDIDLTFPPSTPESSVLSGLPENATNQLSVSNTAKIGEQLSELLAQSLESTVSTHPEFAQEVKNLIVQVSGIKSFDQAQIVAKLLRQFWNKAEMRGNDKTRIHEGLVNLLRLLVDNVSGMVEDEEWLHGQVLTLQEIIANPINRNVIADAERSLRDTIINQVMLKESLSDAKSTLKSLMGSFIDKLGEITESTGEYHQKIEGYSHKIGSTNNLSDLSNLLDEIMQDTSIIQATALRSHEELINTRKQVQQAETEINNLQQELAQISELVREDQLTGALNRRGLDAAFEVESARADRHQSLLSIALLDIDNFKRLNDTLGHQTGDKALVHLSAVIKDALRPTDSVSRYGGEEFVLLLPDSNLEAAAATVERLQRELTKKFFLYKNESVLVTFSAGVAQRAPQESQESVVGRADKAMYQAKHTGKNRVVMAQ
jgi:diguanylate cyclase